MGRRGRKWRLELKTRSWALMAGGVGSIEACRQLGIGRKTGYRGWQGRSSSLRCGDSTLPHLVVDDPVGTDRGPGTTTSGKNDGGDGSAWE